MQSNLILLILPIFFTAAGVWWLVDKGDLGGFWAILALAVHVTWVGVFWRGGPVIYGLRWFWSGKKTVPSGLRIPLASSAAQELKRHLTGNTKIISVYLRQRDYKKSLAAGTGILLKDPRFGIILYIDRAGLTHYASGLNYTKLSQFLMKGDIEGLNVEILLQKPFFAKKGPQMFPAKNFRYHIVVKGSVLVLRRFTSFK